MAGKTPGAYVSAENEMTFSLYVRLAGLARHQWVRAGESDGKYMHELASHELALCRVEILFTVVQ